MNRIITSLLIFFLALGAFGEVPSSDSSERVLRQKSPKKLNVLSPHASKSQALEEKNSSPKTGLSRYSLSILVQTISFNQTTFYRSFKSFGGQLLVSIPVTQWASNSWISVETGPGALYSQISLPQPSTEFSRTQFSIPVLLKASKALSRSWTAEIFLGVIYQPYLYDSRDNTSGGFQKNEDEILQPEGGVGLRLFLNPSVRLKIRASYFYLGSGLEILL
jgi:hypothetical protein